AALPDGDTPGITSWVDGGAAVGSQLASPADGPSETSAPTRPMLVCPSMATTADARAIGDRDSVTVWCGGTVIPVSLFACAWPAAVMTLAAPPAGTRAAV